MDRLDRFLCLIDDLLFFLQIPLFLCRHTANAGVHSGGHPKFRQNPTLQYNPEDDKTKQPKKVHIFLEANTNKTLKYTNKLNLASLNQTS